MDKPATLFRKILKAHKNVLPIHMRVIGDAYVRAEFQQHKKADAKFVPMFMSEWTKYYDTLIATPPSSKLGRELSSNELKALSSEQRLQLKQLKEASTAVGQETTSQQSLLDQLEATNIDNTVKNK